MVATGKPEILLLSEDSGHLKKFFFPAAEQKTVKFTIQTDDIKYVGLDNGWTTEKGEFEVMIENLTRKFNQQD